MTIPIKIQCGCGQHYAFDVEPVDGRMPGEVACPACGSDGTAAANMIIAEILSRQTAPAAASGEIPIRLPAAAPDLHIAAHAPAAPNPSLSRHRVGAVRQVDPEQIKQEARAKIMWGDPPQEVVKFLMIQGFPAQEALAFVKELFQERAAEIRSNGIRSMIYGGLMICVPFMAWAGFVSVGYISYRLFAITVMVGLYGAYRALKGAIMFAAPKSEPGDVSEQ